MLAIYRIFSYFIYTAFLIAGRSKASAGNQLWRGRLGFIDSHGPVQIWIHAASVGEIRIIGYLVNLLLKQQPKLKIHVTTMTPAGHRTAIAQLGDRATLTYFPLDTPPVIKRTLDRIEPEIIVVAETEIWPNLIREAGRRNIPLVQINGRMSQRAFNRYKWIRSLIGKLVNNYHHWFIKTDEDARRYTHLGLRSELLDVAGDMKFDAPVIRQSDTQQNETRLRAGIYKDDFVFVAGSTRPGEERMLIDVYNKLSKRHDNFRMIIAPRHIDRVSEITEFLDTANIQWYLYNSDKSDNTEFSKSGLVIVDTLGQLNDIYQIADLAFVGGTLVPIGGHNLLEPVWAQTPVLFGPYIENVREAAAYIKEHNYGMQVDRVGQLTNIVEEVYSKHKKFALKQESDSSDSTTSRIGTYLLEMLDHA